MRRPALALALALGLALPPAAGRALTAMTAAEFDAYSVGRTLFYAIDGIAYGAEQYLPGRRVVWAFVGEECREGIWHEAGERICFVYDHDPTPQCWTFYATPDGLAAVYANDPAGGPLVEVGQSSEPLACPGPAVGAGLRIPAGPAARGSAARLRPVALGN
ncbi:MAG: hypothetical protein IT545_00415 [Rhodobacteraceae bacterium]|nr:hypothetical protein [Paracoccaceae bacterium]